MSGQSPYKITLPPLMGINNKRQCPPMSGSKPYKHYEHLQLIVEIGS